MNYLVVAQIGVAVCIVLAVLLQQRGTALGSGFGSDGGSYAAHRGIQKKLYWATVFLLIAFVALALWNIRAAAGA
ncbi:MAG: preprotein translocase subunit SecG [Candidatus Wildermuthbacteria bacterium]|nr:preprotein translocase subunit SecG [Candidatus Wildermuthbacteria bacterium]MBI2121181.1 preprotein translocase subunit SecG [Candidatus Wildermuthbacteria bacterium]